MSSELLPIVQDILETKYAVSKEDYKVTADHTNSHWLRFGGDIKETWFTVSLKEYDKHICTWTELCSKEGNVIYYLERDVRKKTERLLYSMLLSETTSLSENTKEKLFRR